MYRGRRVENGGWWRKYLPVTNHLIETAPFVQRGCQFAPNVKPFAGVFVDFDVLDFDADFLDHDVADVVHPVRGPPDRIRWKRWQIHLEKQFGYQVALVWNYGRNTLSKMGRSVEFDWYGLDCVVGVATENVAEKIHLWCSRQI